MSRLSKELCFKHVHCKRGYKRPVYSAWVTHYRYINSFVVAAIDNIDFTPSPFFTLNSEEN